MNDTYRVYLRAFEIEDYKITFRWHNDSEIWDMAGNTKYIVSSEYEKQWIHNSIFDKKYMRFAVCLKENSELIGFCGIMDLDWINRKAQSHYTIGEKKYWGQGIATEAQMLLLDFAFNERNFNRIWTLISEHNIASIKVCEKCGFEKEGVQRKTFYRNGKYHDAIMMSVLKEDFNKIMNEKRGYN